MRSNNSCESENRMIFIIKRKINGSKVQCVVFVVNPETNVMSSQRSLLEVGYSVQKYIDVAKARLAQKFELDNHE